MKLRLWEERPRTAPVASLTGVASEEPADALASAAPPAAGSGVDHADSEHAGTTNDDGCCALLRGEPVRRTPSRRRGRHHGQEH